MSNYFIRKVCFLFFVTLCLSSCINRDQFDKKEKKFSNVDTKEIKIKYAKGFTVDYYNGIKHVKVLHPKNGEILDEFLLKNKNQPIDDTDLDKLKFFNLPMENVVSQSTTHVSYLDKIKELKSLRAVSFADLMKNENAKALYEKGAIQNLTNGSKLNLESLIDIDPELIFMYPFDQAAVENIKEHVPIVLTTEYLEVHPLARLEWIKFFALFYNQEELATNLFDETAARYDSLRGKEFMYYRYFMNLPFQGDWNCPPGNSYSVQLLADAGMFYEYQGVHQDENIKKTREEIIDECIDSPYWIIIAQRQSGFTLEHLKSEDPFYKDFKAVEMGNVIFCNIMESDYFGDALVEPDILLSNLIEVISERKDSTQYFRRLQ